MSAELIRFPAMKPNAECLMQEAVKEWLELEQWLHTQKQLLLERRLTGHAAKVQRLIGIASAEIAALSGEL